MPFEEENTMQYENKNNGVFTNKNKYVYSNTGFRERSTILPEAVLTYRCQLELPYRSDSVHAIIRVHQKASVIIREVDFAQPIPY